MASTLSCIESKLVSSTTIRRRLPLVGVEAGKRAAGQVLALQKRVLAVLNEASCEEPVEPLTLEEVADLRHAPEDIEMICKIIEHMAANDRALIAEGSCGSPHSLKVFLGECNVDELYA